MKTGLLRGMNWIGLGAVRASDSLSSRPCASHLRRGTCEPGRGRGVCDARPALEGRDMTERAVAYQELPSVLFPFCSARR